MQEIIDRVMRGTHIVQIGGFEIAGLGIVVVAAVAADAGRHLLTHVRGEEVYLIDRGIGVHTGHVMAALIAS